MKHRVLSYLTVVAAILLMASCASRRSLERSPMVGGLTGEAYVEKVIAAAPEWKSVTGKVALNLDMGDKGKAKVNPQGGSDSVFRRSSAGHRSGTYGDYSGGIAADRPDEQAVCGGFLCHVERSGQYGTEFRCVAVVVS